MLFLCFWVLVSCGNSSGDGKEQLMVYTSMKEVIIGKIRDEFTAKYPDIEFDYYSAGAGKLMAKIAAERESGKSSYTNDGTHDFIFFNFPSVIACLIADAEEFSS